MLPECSKHHTKLTCICLLHAVQQILLPQIVSWGAMWVCGLLIFAALRQKEFLRASLSAAGQVWTVNEEAARRLMHAEVEAAQALVDAMSEDALAALVQSMMAVSVMSLIVCVFSFFPQSS